jgi:hypothetical protein
VQIKNKYYPYPVIAYGNDSYDGSEFITDANYSHDAHYFKFQLESALSDECLKQMIAAGSVKYAHHIECQQTCFRTLVLTDKPVEEFKVHETKLNGLVQICSFLMADQDIPNYSNPSFSRDYKGFKFNIDRGCVLAIGSQINMIINKEKEELANASSIFSIRRNLDPAATELQVSTTEQKIVIRIPEKTCNQYLNVSTTTLLPVLHAMVIQPALMQVLYELKEASKKHDLYIFEGFRWYRALRKTAEKQELKFDETSISSMDVFKMAQKLLDSPVIKAMSTICSGEGDT